MDVEGGEMKETLSEVVRVFILRVDSQEITYIT